MSPRRLIDHLGLLLESTMLLIGTCSDLRSVAEEERHHQGMREADLGPINDTITEALYDGEYRAMVRVIDELGYLLQKYVGHVLFFFKAKKNIKFHSL